MDGYNSSKNVSCLRCYNSHGEDGDSDGHAAATALPRLHQIARQYALNDNFNANEFALYYMAAH